MQICLSVCLHACVRAGVCLCVCKSKGDLAGEYVRVGASEREKCACMRVCILVRVHVRERMAREHILSKKKDHLVGNLSTYHGQCSAKLAKNLSILHADHCQRRCQQAKTR